MLYVVDAPSEKVVLQLLGSCVEDDVGLRPISRASSFGALASGVDGVYDSVDEDGVTSDGLVIHQPYVNQTAVWVDGVEGVLGVLLSEVSPSLCRGQLQPLGSVVEDLLPGCLFALLVRWVVEVSEVLNPRE